MGRDAAAADVAHWFESGRAGASPPRTPAPAGSDPPPPPAAVEAGAPARAGGTSPGRVVRGLGLTGPAKRAAAATGLGGMSPVLAAWPGMAAERGMLALGPRWLDSDGLGPRRESDAVSRGSGKAA